MTKLVSDCCGRKFTKRLIEIDGILYWRYKFYTPWKIYEHLIQVGGWRPCTPVKSGVGVEVVDE